jgi:hypothetical protein
MANSTGCTVYSIVLLGLFINLGLIVALAFLLVLPHD